MSGKCHALATLLLTLILSILCNSIENLDNNNSSPIQVDQEVLKELLSEKLPRLGAHFSRHGIDASMFTLNWFLCIFVDNIPVKTYLHIWDSFLFEGSKVFKREIPIAR